MANRPGKPSGVTIDNSVRENIMLLINEYELENTGIQCCWKTVLPYIQMSLLF